MKRCITEAVCNAVYMHNWYPTKAVEDKILEEAWSGRIPHISHMRVFGCMAYAKVHDQRQTKLDTKASSVCFSNIGKVPRYIGLFAWR